MMFTILTLFFRKYVRGGTRGDEDDDDDDSAEATLFSRPKGRLMLIMYYCTLPLRFLIYMTIPDVRRPKYENYCLLSIFNCLVWLAIQSYVLVESLTILSTLFNINSVILGLTVGAWVSSYPALWSSIVVARDGLGDMASCNALGSNTFNNLIGLGLPWLTYSMVHPGKAYLALQDDGVVFSLGLLGALLLASYVLIALNNFVLKRW